MCNEDKTDTSTLQDKLKVANDKVDARIDDIWAEAEENLRKLANKNTKKNEQGQTVLSSDSPYRKEEGWEYSTKDE